MRTPAPAGCKRKVGFLGAGYIFTAHAKAVAAIPGLVPHAVCDMSPARARDAASAFGIPHACATLDELIASGCDAVHVLLPPDLHTFAATRLLEAGVDVLLEKPMALSEAECDALTALAAARGRRLGVSHNFLFLPAYERLRAAVRRGELGRIDHLSVDWLSVLPQLKFGPFNTWMLREPGNLLLEVGPHLAAFAVDLLGECDSLQAVAAHPLDLPGGVRAWRRWAVVGECGGTGLALNLSLVPGAPMRRVTVRGLAGVATLDFGRDVVQFERVTQGNAALDSLQQGLRTARDLAAQALANARKAIAGTLRKTPLLDPYRESIYRGVLAFHGDGALDTRLAPAFGSQVIRLCEEAIAASGVAAGEALAARSVSVPLGGGGASHASGAAAGTPREPGVRGRTPDDGERGCTPASYRQEGGDVTLLERPIATSAPESARGSRSALVVGGTGFIGKRLVGELLARGWQVRVLTRSVAAAAAELGALPVSLVQGSHGDRHATRRALEGVAVVYHLAKAGGQRWDDYVRDDVEPTRVLAEAALECGVGRFVYTGTIDSYASADAAATIDETTPLDPAIARRNLYARSKAACEALLRRLQAERGLPLVILRPGIVIGAGAPPAHWGVGLFHSDTRVELWGEGRHPLPFVLVDDVASALALAGDRPGLEGRTLLLTDAPLLSAEEYVAAVSARSATRIAMQRTTILRHFLRDAVTQGLKQLIRHPARREASLHDWACRAHHARYDSSATRAALGWQPAGSRERLLRDGVHAAVDWYLR
ncbi:MAG TPA: NAD-dependent epimerase/dehydratase family protein [Ramlibacter sp.]|nr:NAD-dependent epimerase/dehydratase family protein [Ramlibacter sp.]